MPSTTMKCSVISGEGSKIYKADTNFQKSFCPLAPIEVEGGIKKNKKKYLYFQPNC